MDIMGSNFSCFLLCLSIISFAHAKELSDAEVRSRFEIISEPACKKVEAREPVLPIHSVWYGRYYLSVDGKVDCQILDVKIDWLTGRSGEFRKYLNTVLYKFNGVEWLENRALSYPPKYRIYDKDKTRIYMVVKNDDGDFPVDEVAYFTGTWDEVRGGERAIEKLWFCEKTRECYDEYVNIKRAVFLLDPSK